MKKYEKIQVKGTFFTMKGFYFLFKPLFVPYNKIISKAQELGLKVKGGEKFNGILESPVSFGFGWVGIEIEDGPVNNNNIIKISQEFMAYEHIGSYSGIAQACKDIMVDYPEAQKTYILYLKDINVTPEQDLRTLILFK